MLSSLRRCEAADCRTKHLLLVLLFSVYVSLSKNSFLCACRCISEKRVQRYGLFRYPPNISAEKFKISLIIDIYQAERPKRGGRRLSSPYFCVSTVADTPEASFHVFFGICQRYLRHMPWKSMAYAVEFDGICHTYRWLMPWKPKTFVSKQPTIGAEPGGRFWLRPLG